MKKYVGVWLRGLAMGAADVVPGVSGGTIAFISGIYEELIDSIKSISHHTLRILFKEGIPAAWKSVNGNFLLALILGIFTSIATFARLIQKGLHEYPVLVWSFFFGMIIASTVFMAKKIGKPRWQEIVAFAAGSMVAFYITLASPASTSGSLPYIFLCGAVAICAMILPGISGSFILLLMGAYTFVLGSITGAVDALKAGDTGALFQHAAVIAVFATGAILGLISFARVVSWLFKKYHSLTIAILTGFMFGSLNKVWPWKQVIEYRINSKGEQIPFLEQSVMPGTYAEITGNNPMVLLAILLMVSGFVVIYLLERMAEKPGSEV